MSLVEDTSAAEIAAVLDRVGARLKRLRTQRRMTLTGVAKATGILQIQNAVKIHVKIPVMWHGKAIVVLIPAVKPSFIF